MEKIQNLINDHLKTIEQCWELRDHSANRIKLSSIAKNLIDSIADNGSIPSNINGENYRATTVASVLEALSDAGLLPDNAKYILQDCLIWHQDNYKGSDEKFRLTDFTNEDITAWARDEGASVWATSQALTALIKSGYLLRPNREIEEGIEKIKKAVIWLVAQQIQLGWGFQKYDDICCDESVPMTALSVISLSWAYKDKTVIKFSTEEETSIKNAIDKGNRFILDHLNRNGFCTSIEGNFSMTATVWALEALRISTTDESRYNTLFNRSLKNIVDKILINLNTFTEKDNWQFELFFAGGETKYVGKESLNSFTPYLLSVLMQNNYIEVLDKRVISIVTWLINNHEIGWIRNKTYDAAMALNVIAKWLKFIMGEIYDPVVCSILQNNTADERCCNECGIAPYRSDMPSDAHADKNEKLKWSVTVLVSCTLGVCIALLSLCLYYNENLYSAVIIAVMFPCLLLLVHGASMTFFEKSIRDIFNKGKGK